MKIINKIINPLVYNYYSLCLKTRKKYKFIFILGHTRSGSTLLTHILNTSSEITGCGETWIKYYSESDFRSLAREVHWRLRKFNMSGTYIIDKILHDKFIHNIEILRYDNLYTIFIIRNPYDSLPSILKTGLLFNSFWEEKDALSYYLARLKSLENYAKLINDKSKTFFLTYEQLIFQSKLFLKKQQLFLGLKEPLVEDYTVVRTTGKLSMGDWSDNIKAGRILRTPKSTASSINFPPTLLEKGLIGFNQCYRTLSQCCTTVED